MNKKNELALNDLEKVSGGGKHRDSFVFKQKDGTFRIISVYYDGDDSRYKEIFNTARSGKVPHVDGSTRAIEEGTDIAPGDYNGYISTLKEEGYTIHKMF